MELLAEIVRRKGMQTAGLTIFREAVRGIILREAKLLMIHSASNGDYKFPGGGIAENETHQEALAREIREECGAIMTEFGPTFGKVIEYDLPREPGYDVFTMTSYYYLCQVETVFFEQRLDQYEIELGFQPVWIGVEEAIQENRKITGSNSNSKAGWIPRESFILDQIQKRIVNSVSTSRPS